MFSTRTLKFFHKRCLEIPRTIILHRVGRSVLDEVSTRFGHYHRFIILNNRLLQMKFQIEESSPTNERWLLVENKDLGFKEIVLAIPRIGFDVVLAIPMQVRSALGLPQPLEGMQLQVKNQLMINSVYPKLDVGKFVVPKGTWIGRIPSPLQSEYQEHINLNPGIYPPCFYGAFHVVLLRRLEMEILGVKLWDIVRIINLTNNQQILALIAEHTTDCLAAIYINNYVKVKLGLPEGAYQNNLGDLRVIKLSKTAGLRCPGCRRDGLEH